MFYFCPKYISEIFLVHNMYDNMCECVCECFCVCVCEYVRVCYQKRIDNRYLNRETLTNLLICGWFAVNFNITLIKL